MEGTLRVSPEQLIATANEFSTTGNKMNTLMGTEMMDLVRSLSSVWEGEASQAYIRQFEGLRDDMEKLYRMVAEHSNDLTAMAAEYQNADKTNASLASGLSTDVIV